MLRVVVALLLQAQAVHFLVASMELHLVVHEFDRRKDWAARWTCHAATTSGAALFVKHPSPFIALRASALLQVRFLCALRNWDADY